MKLQISGRMAYIDTVGKTIAPLILRQKHAVIFIHGAQQDHSCWLSQSHWFANHDYCVLAPDLPGHGQSDGPPLLNITAMADWIIALLDTFGINKASIVGHSMGSLIALDLTTRYPRRVTNTVLISSALPMSVTPALLNTARDNPTLAANMINDWSFSTASPTTNNEVTSSSLRDANLLQMQKQPAGTMFVDLNACDTYTCKSDKLSQIATSLLLVTGEQDRMTRPKNTLALAASIPGARITLIPNSGHALMAEKADALLEVLRDFVVNYNIGADDSLRERENHLNN